MKDNSLYADLLLINLNSDATAARLFSDKGHTSYYLDKDMDLSDFLFYPAPPVSK